MVVEQGRWGGGCARNSACPQQHTTSMATALSLSRQQAAQDLYHMAFNNGHRPRHHTTSMATALSSTRFISYGIQWLPPSTQHTTSMATALSSTRLISYGVQWLPPSTAHDLNGYRPQQHTSSMSAALHSRWTRSDQCAPQPECNSHRSLRPPLALLYT